MKWTLILILALSFLIDVEGAISTGKISLENAVPEGWIPAIKAWDGILLYCGNSIMGILAALGLVRNKRAVVGAAAVAMLAAMTCLAPHAAQAGDLIPQARSKLATALSTPYDLTHCGAYYGINTIATTNAVQGDVSPGTQVAQGGVGATIGYGCPINVANGSFWFAEGLFDVTNMNGNVNGLSLSGPASFTQRFGAGTPINNMLSMFGNTFGGSNAPAVPNLPTLPNGITADPGAPYLFAALHEQDISAQVGLGRNSEWMISYGVGLGVRYRLSNGVVADTFAEYKTDSNKLCVGPLGGDACTKLGQGVMVGFQLLY
jgi:hypothetical protein